MVLCCLEEFKVEFDKLKSKNSYSGVEQQIIDYFFNKPLENLKSGTRLNQSDTAPYIKKRLKGRGGYRCYFLLLIKKSTLYLMFIHPKTGSLGAENITDDTKKELYKKVYQSIKLKDYYTLSLSDDKSEIKFTRKISTSGTHE